jgi:hypothetical protein
MTETRTGWFRMSFHRAGRMSAWHWSYGNARSQPKSNAITPGGSYPVAACGYMAWFADSRPEWGEDRQTVLGLPGKVCSKCVNRWHLK